MPVLSIKRFYLLSRVLLICFTLILAATVSFAEDHRVLVEIFTNNGCPLCGRYIPPMQEMIHDNFEADDYLFLTFHTWWPSNNDQWYWENYERNFPDDDDIYTRIDWYGRDQWMGVPSFFYDGNYVGHTNGYVNDLQEGIAERLEHESPIAIEIEAEEYHNNLTLTVTVNSAEDLENLNLFVAICETYIEYDTPGGEHEFFNNLLDMIPDGLGTQFDIAADEAFSVDFEASLDIGWIDNPLENYNITAWVQDSEYNGLQATTAGITSQTSPILIVDASDDPNAGSLLYEVFGENDIPLADRWVRVDEGLVSDELLSFYPTVVWHSFNNDELVISESEESALIGHLEAGGSLILSSSVLCCDLPDRELYRDYLKVSVDDSNLDAHLISGNYEDELFDRSLLFLGGEGGAGTPDVTPSIQPGESAYPILYYSDGDRETGVAGVSHITDSYRAMTLSFPIESISGGGGTEELTAFMGRVAQWLELQLAAPLVSAESPQSFSLDPAYPNPFNSAVTVPFTLSADGNVSLRLINPLGRTVTQLSQGHYSAGQHRIAVNGSSMNLSSGIYYMVLTVGDETRGQIIAYIR